jgi:hypothetical protein
MIEWPVQHANKKYARWYDSLIAKAQSRTIVGYSETHHIVPRSFGGNDSKANLVKLTAREHYIAHALLWKMKFTGVYGSKMAFAFNTFISKMTTKVRGVHHTYTISSRTYEVFRKEYSAILKEKWAREGANFKGKKHSEETKRIIGEKSKLKVFKRGPENPQWGKKQNVSPEGKAARLAAIKANWDDPVWKQKILEHRKEVNKRPEVIAARKAASDARVGVKRDPVAIEKTAAAKRNKTWEELYTPEQIERMRTASKNKVYTPEGKQRQIENSRMVGSRPKSNSFKKKMSERMKGIKRPTVACEHCGKECVRSNYNQWHGINCKHKGGKYD